MTKPDEDRLLENQQSPSDSATAHETVVKNLGRKARLRLEEERKRRREIIRIDAAPQPYYAAPANAIADFSLEKSPPVPIGQKRRRINTPKRSLLTAEKQSEALNVDKWMPDIRCLTECWVSEVQSSLISLHGLPVGTSSAHIRRFFTGLDPQKIVLLIPNPSMSFPTLLDADHDSVPRTIRGMHVQRYAATKLRVMVKFPTIRGASLAIDRSGEILSVLCKANENGDGNGVKEAAAAIAIAPVPKYAASFFLKEMFIDIDQSSVMPLDAILYKMQEKLDPIVSKVLWLSAIQVLRLKPIINRDKSDEICGWLRLHLSVSQPTTHQKQMYQMLAKHRNALLHAYNNLRYKIPYQSLDCMEPQFISDPLVYLTTNAAKILLQEIERADEALLQSRRWHFFF